MLYLVSLEGTLSQRFIVQVLLAPKLPCTARKKYKARRAPNPSIEQAAQKPTSEQGEGLDTTTTALALVDPQLTVNEPPEHSAKGEHPDIKINSSISNDQGMLPNSTLTLVPLGKGTECSSTQILAAVEEFRYDLESGIARRLGKCEERRKRLEQRLDHSRFESDLGMKTLESMRQELQLAEKRLTQEDNEKNQADVKCCGVGVKCAEDKLAVLENSSHVALVQWQAHCALTMKKYRAQ